MGDACAVHAPMMTFTGSVVMATPHTWATDAGLGILLCQIAFMSLPHAPTDAITPHETGSNIVLYKETHRKTEKQDMDK